MSMSEIYERLLARKDKQMEEERRRFEANRRRDARKLFEQMVESNDEKLAQSIENLDRAKKMMQIIDMATKRLMDGVPESDRIDADRVAISFGPKVYMLLRDGICVYIGSTEQPWPIRAANHCASKTKPIVYDTAIGYPCTRRRKLAIEKAAIKKLKPEYNVQGKGRGVNYFTEEEADAIIRSIIGKKRIR